MLILQASLSVTLTLAEGIYLREQPGGYLFQSRVLSYQCSQEAESDTVY